jgi:Tfp pilus assembly protein PilX
MTFQPDTAARRRGLAIVPALACLVVVVLFCGILVRQVSTHRALVRDEERRMQAEWLADSALARASARLAADRSYKGETWDLAAADLGGQAGVARITVETVADQATRRRVRVEADFPREGDLRARSSKTLTVDLGPERPGGPR